VEHSQLWFEELQQVNSELLAAAKRAKAEKFLRRSAVEKYAEPTHFVFELLQNADDQEAKTVRFKLLPDGVQFSHSGKPFTPADVERITRLGDSDKPNEMHKIGSFGIGFKSVFAVTDRPEVYCQIEGRPFAFAIEELIVPIALATDLHQGPETIFLLPYNEQQSADRSSETAAQLTKTGPEVLMFLNHIEELVWEDSAGRGERYRRDDRADGTTIFERTPIGSGRTRANRTSYRLFRRPVVLPDGRPSDVCLAFRLNDAGKAVGESSPTKLWVYFETEEQIGFRCRVHGPFKLTDSRANMMRSEPFNRHLIGELSTLATDALRELQHEERLVRETLNALPIPADDITEIWAELPNAIWKTLREEPVLPTAGGDYATAVSLWQGTRDFRSVLADTDLAILAGQDRFWAVSAGQSNSRIDRLLVHVGVEELTLDGLLKQLEATAEHAGRLEGWFASHDDAWLQSLYLLLNGIKGYYQVLRLKNLPIVRTVNGDHARPNKVRFAPDGDRADGTVAVRGISLVAPGPLAGSKQVREDVTTFLRRIGVNNVDEEDYIQALLAQHYRPGSTAVEMDLHRRHLERFAIWLAAHPNRIAVFDGSSLFLTDGSDKLRAVGDLYIDKPFDETGLAAIYGAQGPLENKKKPLAARYRGVKGVADLARRLGVTQWLQPERRSTSNHPERSVLKADWNRPGTRWGNAIDTDWVIPDLERILAKPDAAVSLCIWRSLQALERSFFFASFRHAESYPIRQKPASFVYQLRSLAWLPSSSGSFLSPEDITEGELPSNFDRNDRTGWVEAIGLGSKAKRKAAEYQQQRQFVLQAGIPDEFAERFQELSEEEKRSVLEAGFRQLTTSTPFPEREAPDPERRARRLAERVRTAP
jgi:hypothetical protein